MYFHEYRWMRKPTPVTTSAIVPLRASSIRPTEIENVPPPVRESETHSQPRQASLTTCPSAVGWIRKKQTRLKMNEPAMLDSPISVTASLPRRLPNRPFTRAPSRGKRTMNARSVMSCDGKREEISFMAG
jgi:hypothetical protein